VLGALGCMARRLELGNGMILQGTSIGREMVTVLMCYLLESRHFGTLWPRDRGIIIAIRILYT
jgi:hypothetical protein